MPGDTQAFQKVENAKEPKNTQSWQAWPGLLAAIVVGVLSWVLGNVIPNVGAVTIAILIGVALGNLLPNIERINPGTRLAEKRVLPVAIALLGVELQLATLLTLGPAAAIVIFTTVGLGLGMGVYIGHLMGYSRTFSLLMGAGNGICGSSAVAATSTALHADESETGISISVVNLLGTVGIFLIPLIAGLFSLNDMGAGLLVGGTLQAVGQVVAAGNIISPEVGVIAIAVKMGRVLMLGPVVILISTLVQRGTQKTTTHPRRLNIPLFIVGFFLLSVLASLNVLPAASIDGLRTSGKFLLVVAMAGIGMRIQFQALYKSGPKAILFGMLISTVQLIATLILIFFLT